MNCLGLCVNLSRLGVTQYQGYDFQGIATVAGIPIAGGPDGLFQLDNQGADIMDPGDPATGTRQIDAFFELVTSDFAEPKQKRVKHLLVSGETDGDLNVSVTYDQAETYTTALKPPTTGNQQEGLHATGSRRLKGRHVAVGVQNVDGSDFSVDAISLYLERLGHRRGR